VVAVIFSFLATCFRATLRGLLGGVGRLASKLVGGSSMRGMKRPGISVNGNPNLSTSVVVPGGYHVQSLFQRFQNPYRKVKQDNRVQYLFYYINQSTISSAHAGYKSIRTESNRNETSSSGFMKARELHLRRQLKCRKSSSPPNRRCRSRSPALRQSHQGLPDKRVGHVSFPTKRQKRCMF
jgi:hypothetical protein